MTDEARGSDGEVPERGHDAPTVAVFRPDDGRLAAAAARLEELGATPVADPMLAVEPTGATPRRDADVAILTSVTGVRLVADAKWDSGDARLCAIGDATADALRDAGYRVDLVPDEFSSTGLVDALAADVDGARVEVARSVHGSAALLEGLEAAGAYCHETVLYRLVQPPGAGESAELAATGALDAAAFTSSLTVEHFLAAAEERGVRDEAIEGLRGATVAAIGEPTRETAVERGLSVDVVPETADVDGLLAAAVAAAREQRDVNASERLGTGSGE